MLCGRVGGPVLPLMAKGREKLPDISDLFKLTSTNRMPVITKEIR